MAYKILKMGDVYTINRIDKTSYGIEYRPSLPIRYYKTKTGAIKSAKKRGMKLV